jgi:hypothetical protein
MALLRGDYRFLPWFRRGMATRMRTGSGLRSVMGTGLTVTVNGFPRNVTVSELPLYSAGDVRGIDPNIITRMSPTPDAQQVEGNFFPILELNQPDLPWRYTPSPAVPLSQVALNHVRILPWLCLIALKDGEYSEKTASTAQRSLPTISVNATTPLPKLSQAWAWAHVQISGLKFTPPVGNSDADIAPALLFDYLETNPGSGIARLICPRRLDDRTRYTIFLVPTLIQGVDAGLGREYSAPMDAMRLAWEDNRTTSVELPIYHRWSFHTGVGGDFELLVSQLNNYVVPPEVGTRPMDVQRSGTGLPQ